MVALVIQEVECR